MISYVSLRLTWEITSYELIFDDAELLGTFSRFLLSLRMDPVSDLQIELCIPSHFSPSPIT